MATSQDIVRLAREHIGTPFYHAGRAKGLGVDCVGLLLSVAYELGLTTYDNRNYNRHVQPDFLEQQLKLYCEEVPRSEMKVGDIILLKIRRHATHVAINAGRTLIHSYEPAGQVLECAWSEGWEDKIHLVLRWRDLEDFHTHG